MAENVVEEHQEEEEQNADTVRAINNIIGNVPVRIEALSGETIEVRSKSIEDMLLIDDLIYSLEDIGDSTPDFTVADFDDLDTEELKIK